jgi:plasmid stabilization system protein ParE
MPRTLTITSKAQKDVSKAYDWYEDKVTGLGFEFIQNVDARIKHIVREPQHFQHVYGNSVRRALVSRFPFAIYFVELDSSLIVFAILHQRVNPSRWKTRKRK